MYITDTIAAVATPAGYGGVGVIRVSGDDVPAIALRVFRAATAPEWRSHQLYHGRVVTEDGQVLDEALAVIMRSPQSYTGENVLEIQCHGSPVVVRNVLALILRSGARLAEPGEFTKRAFLNGRIDLTQAEAVMDIVGARGDAAAALAVSQLMGGLSRQLADVRETLVHLKSLLEAQIDFSDEDFEVGTAELECLARKCERTIDELVESFGAGKIAREGLHVVIAGKPNVGKSSLLNALLREDRAIVTDVPGTTRDTIQETANFEGVSVLLTDTAGLRPLDEADPIERLGIERSSTSLAAAEVGLLVLDVSRPIDEEDRRILCLEADTPRLLILNKIDLPAQADRLAIQDLGRGRTIVEVSAKTGQGLSRLRRAVLDTAHAGFSTEPAGPIVTNLRHKDVLGKGLQSIRLARQSLADGCPPDVVAVDVQDALDRIGEITGAVTNDEILDRIFSQFCIGK